MRDQEPSHLPILVGLVMAALVLSIFGKLADASTTTSNMSLVIPSVGDTSYPTSISDSFTLIDAHDHSTGKGVVLGTSSVPTAAIQALAVTTAKIAALNVTRAKIEAVGQQVSSSANDTDTGTTARDVVNLSVSITTSGRHVIVGMMSDGSGSGAGRLVCTRGAAICAAYFYVLRGATEIGRSEVSSSATGATAIGIGVPCSGIQMIDAPVAGTYTYKVQAAGSGASDTWAVNLCKLYAYEL